MQNMRCFFNFSVFILLLALLSGCIRLQAGYVTENSKERKERTVGIDTEKLIENKKTSGDITT